MQKASSLADDLWPYLLPKVQRVNRNGGGRVVSGGETGSAPSGVDSFFELIDVEPTGWDDGEVPIWSTSAGKLVPGLITGGGGLTYTAGNGIAISGATISTKHKSGGGIVADSLGLYIVLNSESGLGLDTNGLRVGAGNGIDIAGDLTAVHLGIGSGLTFDGVGGLVVAATLAGSGLDLTAGVMSVNVTEGIEYSGDALRVDEDYSFIWDGTHRFNATPQLNANLNFIGADRTITSAAGIDLTFDLGADLILASPKTFRSADYLDDIPIAGFSLFPNTGGDRQLTINTIKSDSLHTRLFVADGVRIDIGEERWGKSMGIVHDDFFVPTLVGNMVTVFFEDSPMLTGALFSSGDWVVFKYLNQGVNFAYGLVWGQVTSYVNRGLDADGRGYQSWSFTLRHGDAGVLIKKGNVAVDYGVAGQGYAFLSVLSDAVGPWFRIGTWSGANPYTAGNTQIRTQMGNLAGISDAALNPSGYGLYSDNVYLHGILRTAETIMDDEGLAFERQYLDGDLITDSSEFSRIAWWDSLSDRTGSPPIEIIGYKFNSGLEIGVFNQLSIGVGDSEVDASFIDIDAGSTAIHLDSRGTMRLSAFSAIQAAAHLVPYSDLTYDLGTTSLRWRNLYVDHLYVTGAISGDVLSGQEWEYPGSMTIDAHGSGNLLVSVTNQGTGRADLSVDRDIIVGGSVDGVDISAHDANPSAHHNLASAGDGISVAVGQIISVDGSVVRTPATVLRTTQLLLTDIPLTGGGQLGDGLTIRLLLAAVDPGLTSATGGLGVLLAATTPGLTLTGGLQVDSSVARTTVSMIAGLGLVGGGTLAANRTFDVGAGAGILVGADDVAVDFTAVPHIGTLMIAGAGLVGGGDLSANRTFDVVAGNGTLTVSADSMVVNQGFTFAWTGAQTWAAAATFNGVPTFNSAPQVNANLAFIGADRTMTASGNLTLQPASNLTLNPLGNIVYLPDDVEERSSTFADLVTGINGFRLWTTGGTARQLTIGSIKADSFVTRTFVADTIRLEQGDSYWGKGYGIVNTDFVLPAVNADVNVWFDNVPNTAGDIFTAGLSGTGDKLLARFVVWTAGISVKLIWFNVQAKVSDDAANFRQRWTLRRLSGGVTGDTVIKGVAVEDAGATGQGWIHVTSLGGGPYMEFGTQTSVAAGIPQFTQNVRIGQLSGTVDYASSAWGFATGNNLGIGPTAGFSGITIDNTVQGLRVFNAAYQLFNGANLILSLEKSNGLSLEFGSAAFNSIGWYEDLGTGTPSGLMGSVGAARAISGYTELDIISTGIAGSYSTGAVRLRGVNASAVAYNLWVDSSGVYFGTGTTLVARPLTGGFIQDSIQYLSGYVGIGVTGPTSMLHVVQPSTTDYGLSVFNSNAGISTFPVARFGLGATYALQLKHILSASLVKHSWSVNNNSVDYPDMLVFDRGKIGMGTQTPDATLHITQSSTTDYTLKAYNGSATGTNPVVSLGLGVGYSLNLQTIVGSSLVKHSWGVFNNVTNYPDMLVFDRGNIGIGTQSPLRVLHIGGGGQTPFQTYEGVYINPNATIVQMTLENSGGVEGGMFAHSNGNFYVGTWPSNPLVFRTNNADRMTIAAAGTVTMSGGDLIVSPGYVGIGVASPTSMLHIVQPSSADYALSAFNNNAAGTYPVARFGFSTTFALQLKSIVGASLVKHSFGVTNNGTDYDNMLVLDRGNIGIGNSDPIGELEVLSTSTTNANRGITTTQISASVHAGALSFMKARGTRASKGAVVNGDYLMGINGYGWDGSAWMNTVAIQARSNGAISTGNIPTDLLFLTGGVANNLVERMRITSTGSVGIGVAAPATTLDVMNLSTTLETARLTTSGTVDLFSMFLRRSRGTAASPTAVANGDVIGGIGFGGYTNAGWATPNSGSIELWAMEDFNTGVTGKTGAEMRFRTKALAAGAARVLADITITAAGGVVIPYLLSNTGAGTAVVVQGSGLLVATSSSLRFKTDIREMPEQYGDAFVMALRPILYKSKGSDPPDVDWPGFAAEQVEELGGIPFVSYDKEGLVNSLHYERLTVPLVMTAQKQQRRIAELEARVAQLENHARRKPTGAAGGGESGLAA